MWSIKSTVADMDNSLLVDKIYKQIEKSVEKKRGRQFYRQCFILFV